MQEMRFFRPGLDPGLRWGILQRSLRPPSWIKGVIFKGMGKGEGSPLTLACSPLKILDKALARSTIVTIKLLLYGPVLWSR